MYAMRKILLIAVALSATIILKAEQISSVESSGSWIYMYNSQGKKYKTLSASTVGTVVGYTADFFVSENGSWIYIWTSDGRKYKTLSKSTVGNVLGAAGDTFTSRNGNWIYTWNKEGKKINTRYAQ